jgi:uncharacterized membrane protein YsdA (DUF1294 family)
LGFKSLIGALFILSGLGAGLYEWFLTGLSSPVPFVGIALCVIGVYLIYSDLRKKRRTIDKTLVDVTALIGGAVAGIIAMEKLKSKLESSKFSNPQIAELEAQLEGLRAQGKVSDEKYAEIKLMIEELKRRSGQQIRAS